MRPRRLLSATVVVAAIGCSASSDRPGWRFPTADADEGGGARLFVAVSGDISSPVFVVHNCETRRVETISQMHVYGPDDRVVCKATHRTKQWRYPYDAAICSPLSGNLEYGVFMLDVNGGRGASRLSLRRGRWREIDNICH